MSKCKKTLILLIFLYFFQLTIPALGDTFSKTDNNCSRSFTYRNRTYSVDSSRKLDGEGLRKVFKTNSESEILLNNYQSNKKVSNIPAYTGTLGFATGIYGIIYSGSLEKTQTLGKRDTRYVALGGGILLIGSYFFAKYLIQKNENTLSSAVDRYNASASPSERIQVSLEPLANPDGGQIKTIVPFSF